MKIAAKDERIRELEEEVDRLKVEDEDREMELSKAYEQGISTQNDAKDARIKELEDALRGALDEMANGVVIEKNVYRCKVKTTNGLGDTFSFPGEVREQYGKCYAGTVYVFADSFHAVESMIGPNLKSIELVGPGYAQEES